MFSIATVSYITLAVSDRRGLIQSVISLWLLCESAWVGEACIFEIRLSESKLDKVVLIRVLYEVYLSFVCDKIDTVVRKYNCEYQSDCM